MIDLQTNLARFLDLLGLAGVLDVLEVHLRILEAKLNKWYCLQGDLWILEAKINQMISQKKPGVSASTSSPLPLEDNSAEDEKDADSKTLGTLRMHIKSKHQIYCIQPDLSTSSPFKTLEESSAEDEQDDICSNAVSRTWHMSGMHIKRKHQTYCI